MRSANLHFADLEGTLLGLAFDNTIQLDRDAAGFGWFADTTPADDDEFTLLASDVLHARSTSAAAGRIDLVTAVLHELGHLAGLSDETTDDLLPRLMDDSLAPGIRKLPRLAR